LIPLASDGVIACGGNTGTLSELAYCDLYKRPLVCLTSVPGWSKEIGIKGSFRIPSIKKGVLTAQTGGEAVRKLLKVLSSSK
ncbi:MAG: SLOG cluster 4 domain-containing protein, partial [Candidatus Hodarchaeales archaeon]